MGGWIPNARAGRARFGDARIPKHLPMGLASARADATVDARQRAVGEAD